MRERETDAEEVLRALGSAIRDASDELYVFDLDGRILEANDGACRALGFTREELLGLSVWEISTRQTKGGFERLVQAIRSDGDQFLFGHNRRKDGSAYSVEARLWIASFRGREAVYGLLRDAGGYQGLIEERDQLISLIEHSREAIAVTTSQGEYSYMNPAGLELLGLERVEQVSGMAFGALHPEAVREELARDVLPAVRKGSWQGELAFLNFETGSTTPCWVNAFAIRHSQTREVIGLALVAHDISERKAAERQRQKLLELNQVSRQVATSLLEGDDLNRAIGHILSGVGGLLGVSRSYLCRYREKRDWVYRTHQWTPEEGAMHLMKPTPESAEPYSWATEILVRGDVIRIADVNASGIVPKEGSGVLRPDVHALLVMPVIIRGRMESFFGFVDTTGPREWEDEEFAILQIIVDSFARAVERRVAERDRAQIALDLEHAVAREKEANRSKSAFLASMSHELRTPMNAIVGYAELLSRPEVSAEKQRTWVTNIQKSTNYLLALINDVLDLSKLEAGQMNIEVEPCSLTEMISSVDELLRGQAEERRLDFRIEYDGPLPEFVEVDPVRLKQILVNLISNAIKFTEEGSVHVRISTEESTHGGVRKLVVAVHDTGIGIAAKDLKLLFQPFSQVRNQRRRTVPGTGLGLDISRHLARLMGGDIEVVSEAGKGSVFTLRITLRGASSLRLASDTRGVLGQGAGGAFGTHGGSRWRESPADVSLEGVRVLVVDDSVENRAVLRFLLDEAGCQVDTAENGALGVKRAEEAARLGQPYDAILMDMNMPVMDGYEAAQALQKSRVGSPVIALTALAMSGDKDRCLAAGCVDYISKPVVPAVFLETVGRHVHARSGSQATERTTRDASSATPQLALVENPRFEPLIKRYIASFSGLIDEIRGDYQAGQLEELRTRVHRVRGTAASYGFPDVSAAAGEVEDQIRAGADLDQVGPSIEVLLNLLQQVSQRAG